MIKRLIELVKYCRWLDTEEQREKSRVIELITLNKGPY